MAYKQSDLTIMTCEACNAADEKIDDAEMAELFPQIPDWEKVEVDGTPQLQRIFEFDGWVPAIKFVNLIGEEAEENSHHPRICLEWGKVQVNWWTHRIGALHRNDFIMAAKTDTIWKAR